MQSEFEGGRQELHLLIDRLPAEQVTAALQYMHYLCADPVLLSLMNAQPDDEPYTDEERKQDAEAMAAIARGEGISHAEILSEFGLNSSEHV
jgi:hypothetical protein